MALPQIKTPRYQIKLHTQGQSYARTMDLPNGMDEQQALSAFEFFVSVFGEDKMLAGVSAVSLYHYPSNSTVRSVSLDTAAKEDDE